jgi:GNAT superfamily N-acetyltransferase
MFDPAALDAGLRAPQERELARVEEAGLNASQPSEQLLLDGWLLRFSAGKARRARSVNAIAAGRLPLDEKLALSRHWYERFCLPLLVRITPFSQPAGLDDYLQGAGFIAFDETRVMTCSRIESAAGDASLITEAVDIATFVSTVDRLRDSPSQQVDAQIRRLRNSPLGASTVRLVGYEDKGAAAVAAGQVVVERELAGLYDIVVAPSARGRGHGCTISRRLLRAALGMGASTAYLQVDAGNVRARQIYAALGFVDRYAYWYRRPSATADEVPA